MNFSQGSLSLLEYLSLPVLEIFDVVVDKVLLVDLLLVPQAYQCEALVCFPEVEHDLVVLAAAMIQLDDAA